MLVILLYVTSGHNIEEFVSAGCCILIFISNVAVLFLLERMEYAASEREQLLMLNQQIQLQSKNMTSASELYSAQRKKVHDFRAAPEYPKSIDEESRSILPLKNNLEKITEQQTESTIPCQHTSSHLGRTFQYKSRRSKLKRRSALNFEVNDLNPSFHLMPPDMVVLLSNLLDNAIEACQQYDKGDKSDSCHGRCTARLFLSLSETHRNLL